jgi:ubiquinone/menaquinone biosynthesis C-methylase UbiE
VDPLRDFFENLASEWDAHQPIDRESTLLTLFSLIDAEVPKSAAILNVGTGTGAVIPVLMQRYPDAQITSIDLAWEMLHRARQRVRTARLVQCDVHTLPFPTHSFSIVICHNSFPHFIDKSRALDECKRVLKQHGKLVILHDLNKRMVNHVHHRASSSIIQNDLLLTNDEMRLMVLKSGFKECKFWDEDTYYLVIAKV